MKAFRYSTGDEVQTGDRIKLHGEPGTIEFIVDKKRGDPELDWNLEEHPEGGVMITNKAFGRVFISATGIDEHLEFVSRLAQ